MRLAAPAGTSGRQPEPDDRDRRPMSRRPPHARAGARTQQAGTVSALALMPSTFQRTLMPRSTLDQALITGICGALDYGFAALIQDTVEAAALRLSGAASPEQADPHTWRRASVAADLATIALGLAGQTACRPRPGERVARGAVRTICWWVSATGLCGASPACSTRSGGPRPPEHCERARRGRARRRQRPACRSGPDGSPGVCCGWQPGAPGAHGAGAR
jgi:hypothetical protein